MTIKRTRKKEATVVEKAAEVVEQVQNIEQIMEETPAAPVVEAAPVLQVQVPPIVEEAPKPASWRKTGKGSLRWGNRIIKPGQIFEAFRKDIPNAFLNTLEEITPEVMPEKYKETVQPVKFSKVETEGGFNIVDSHGRVLNEKVLNEDEVNDLLKQLL